MILVPLPRYETPPQDLTTPDGTSVWAGDGVHLTSPAYRVAARLLTAELERSASGEMGEPATKRPRLESVVPAAAPPPAKPVFKAPPPTPKPVAPPLWLSGQLPANTTATGTAGTTRTTVEAEEVEEGVEAEAADEAAAATAERTSLTL